MGAEVPRIMDLKAVSDGYCVLQHCGVNVSRTREAQTDGQKEEERHRNAQENRQRLKV